MRDAVPAVDLASLAAAGDRPGALWRLAGEDLQANLIRLGSGGSHPAAPNDEVEVLMVVVAGRGELTLDGRVHPLTPIAASLAVAPPGSPMGDSGLVTALQQAGRGAPVTRRLLVVAAAAAMLGLVAAPALDETAVGGWFGLPLDSSRGLGQPEQQGEPTAPPTTTNQQSGNLSQRSRRHAKPHPRGHGPKLRRPKGKPDTAGRPASPPARDLHAPPRPAHR